MNQITQWQQERGAAITTARAVLDAAEAEKRALSADEEKRYNDLIGQADGLQAKIEREQALVQREASLSVSQRSALKPTNADLPMINSRTGRGDNEANAWRSYLRDGDRGGLRHLVQAGENGEKPQIVLQMPTQRQTRVELESRAVTDSTMNITTSGDGGALVPTTLVGQIALRKNERILAERLGCRRVPGVGTTVNFPYESADPDNFAATSEQSDAHGNNYERAAFQTALKAFTLAKFSRKVELTEEMLEDVGVDLMSFIADKIAREIGRTHNGLLVTEVEANGTSLKTFGSNSAIAIGELEALIGNDTLGFYLEDATDVHWVMRSSTHWAIKAVRGDARAYSGDETGLLGYNTFYSNKADAIGASGKSVLFGDWNYMGYREAPELRFIQDPYTVDGMVVLKYSFRAVYGILQAGAIGYGVHP